MDDRRELERAANSFEKARKQFRRRVRRIRAETDRSGATLTRRLRRTVLLGIVLLIACLFVVPPFLYPVDGRVTSGMFIRFTPEPDFLLNVELHRGLDIAAPAGAPVRAARSGRVIQVAHDPDGYGRYAVVRHMLGFTSLYGHMDAVGLSEGDLVWRGARLGSVGTTGRTTGPHLHFEVKSYGGAIFPPRLVLFFHSVRRAMLGF